MLFTALHRALGRPPGPLTNDMIDQAVEQGIPETTDLDWKEDLPPTGGLSNTDYPKDVAALANAGGGVLVYGVKESDKAAAGRKDTGNLTEPHAAALTAAAVSAISPPLFGVEPYLLGEETRAVVVVVPASIDVPHLIYRNKYFGAPLRNGPDTEWMLERQIDARYRARFEEQRTARDELNQIYSEAAGRMRGSTRTWAVAAARPRLPVVARQRLLREEARSIFLAVDDTSGLLVRRGERRWPGPARTWNDSAPRPGLRRWVAPPISTQRGGWADTWATVHDDGSVTLAWAVGGSPNTNEGDIPAADNVVRAEHLETFVADFISLIRLTAHARGASEYDPRATSCTAPSASSGCNWLKAGLESATDAELVQTSSNGFSQLRGEPAAGFTPVSMRLDPHVDETELTAQARDLATDLVNQGGILATRLLGR